MADSTSFGNTPQAVNDTFTAAATGINEDSTITYNLNVMANDLGGNAKSLYSIDDGSSTGGIRPVDLLSKDMVGVAEKSAMGAKIAITADGQVSYTVTDVLRAALQHLGAGQFATDTFTYAIQLGNGTLSWASATVQIGGVNDAPTVTALSAAAAEGGAPVQIDGLSGAHDADDGTTLTIVAPSALPAGVTYDAATHKFSIDPSHSSFDSLAAGEHATVVVSYGVSDGIVTTPNTITFTIDGTNDAPVVASALTYNGDEGHAPYYLNLLAGASDVDHGETATLAVANVHYTVDGVAAAAPAGVSLSGHTLTVDPTNAAFNALNVHEHTTIVVSYDVVDAHGATVHQTETITINGTNDAPIVAAPLADTHAEGAPAYTLDLLAGASDVDHGETATLTVAHVSYTVDGVASANPDGISLSGHTLTVDPTHNAFNSLAVGEHATIVVSYDVTDAQGATVHQTETITITGTNDAPVVASALTYNGSEGHAPYSLDLLAGASDVDHGETATLTVANVSYTVDGVAATSPDGVSLSGHTLTVDPTHHVFDSLAVGEHATIVVSYDVTDAQGATVHQTETITITGTNDAPVVAAALTYNGSEGHAPYYLNLLAGASDVDHGETATLTVANVSYTVDGVASANPDGVSLSGHTLTVDPTHNAFNSLAVGEHATIVVSYDVTDAQGATVHQTETITITGTNDAPVVAAALTDTHAEGDASYTLNLLAGASDVDHGETATLTVANVSYTVDGVAATSPDGVSLSGHTLTVDPTHNAFNSLAVGEHATIVVSYDVTDAQGATVHQTETITITGTNDAPVVAAALTDTHAEGDASYTLNLLAGASDVDHGETATLTVANVSYTVDGVAAASPDGVSLSGHTLTVDPTHNAFNSLAVGEHATIVVSYDVTDAQGATVHQTETITITGTNDAPVVAAALTDTHAEGDASYTLNLLAGASDVDHGETATLTVANVSYTVDGVAATSPDGVSLSGHTLTVDPTHNAFNSLAVGEHATIVVSYDVTDAQGATVHQTETITITGTNDAPIVAAALTDTHAEGDASYTLNLLAGASDVDHGETATLTVANVSYTVDGVAATSPDGVSLSGHTLTVDPTHNAFNSLAVGEHATIVVSYDVTDAQGATVHQTETITITGTNDAPIVAAALTDNHAEGAPAYTLDLLAGASDVDHGETATLTVANVSYTVDGVAAATPAGISLSGHTLSVDPTHNAFNSLAVGEHATIVVSYDVTDAQGATVHQTETITITGTNDAPIVAAALTDTHAEGAPAYTLNLLAGASDVDHGETATLTVANVSYTVDGVAAATPAGISLSGHTLSVDPTHNAFNSLAVGEHATIVVSYDVTDAQGATVHQTETITITGTNDAPVVAAALTDTHAEGVPAYTLNLLAGASDVDHGETAALTVAHVTYSVDGGASSETAPAGLSLSGGTLSVDPTHGAFNGLAVGEHTTIVVGYDVTDAQGATVHQTETITINGTNDAPVVAGALTSVHNEGDAAYSLNLLSGASDPDHSETASLTVAHVTYSVDGGASSGTAPAGLSLSGSSLTVDPTHGAFNGLAVGEHTTIVVGFDVTDAQGATVHQTETITINGTNDAPVVAGALTSVHSEGDAAYTLNLLTGASDVDHGDVLSLANVTYALNGGAATGSLPSGISMGLDGHTLTVDPTHSAFDGLAAGEHATIAVGYDIGDGHGGVIHQTETITINGVNDAPTVAAALTATANQGAASFTADLLTGAHDVDHGDVLSLTNVLYSVNGGAGSGTAPTGVSMGLDGHTLTIDPTSSAFNGLLSGQHSTIAVGYDVVDGHGGLVHQTETVTINGMDHAPTDIIFAATNPADATSTPSVVAHLTAVDPDAGDSVTFSIAAQTKLSGAADTFTITNGNELHDGLNPHGSAVDSYDITVRATDSHGATYDEHVFLTFGTNATTGDAITGATGNDIIFARDNGTGGSQHDVIHGGSGDDQIFGQGGTNDLFGDDGNDVLTAGSGKDTMTGGNGSDTFVFANITDSDPAANKADRITDFVHGQDKIDLHLIDADPAAAGVQNFTYGGANANAVLHGVTWSESGGDTIVHVNAGGVDSHGAPTSDMTIVLTGTGLGLTASDFKLT
jgi:VCBS repeat-containing protein